MLFPMNACYVKITLNRSLLGNYRIVLYNFERFLSVSNFTMARLAFDRPSLFLLIRFLCMNCQRVSARNKNECP